MTTTDELAQKRWEKRIQTLTIDDIIEIGNHDHQEANRILEHLESQDNTYSLRDSAMYTLGLIRVYFFLGRRCEVRKPEGVGETRISYLIGAQRQG